MFEETFIAACTAADNTDELGRNFSPWGSYGPDLSLYFHLFQSPGCGSSVLMTLGKQNLCKNSLSCAVDVVE